MDIELVPEERFTVRVNGKESRGFFVVSEWEGLRKLQRDDGKWLILSSLETGGFEPIFRQMFAGIRKEPYVIRCGIIGGSLDLLHGLEIFPPVLGKTEGQEGG